MSKSTEVSGDEQCLDTVGWVTGRKSARKNLESAIQQRFFFEGPWEELA